MPDPTAAQIGNDCPLPRRRKADLQTSRAAAKVGGQRPETGSGTVDAGVQNQRCRAGHAAYVYVRRRVGLSERVEGGGDVAGHGGEGGSVVALVVSSVISIVSSPCDL